MDQLAWSPRSLTDLEIIYEYIRQDSEENARMFVRELIGVAVNIPEFPFSGRECLNIKIKKLEKKYTRIIELSIVCVQRR